jgi:hypothetical protein
MIRRCKRARDVLNEDQKETVFHRDNSIAVCSRPKTNTLK